jgi:hypothetical protein
VDADLAVSSAKALSIMKAKQPAAILTQLLRHLRSRKAGKDREIEVARAIVILNHPESTRVVEQFMGTEWVTRQRAVIKLKTLPDHYLPNTTQ